jgi:hypothetical protein
MTIRQLEDEIKKEEQPNAVTPDSSSCSPPDAHTTMWLGIVIVVCLTVLAGMQVASESLAIKFLEIFSIYAGLRYVATKLIKA